MEKQLQESELPRQAENVESSSDAVVSIFGRRRVPAVPPLTTEEILEWRRVRGQIVAMIQEWRVVKNTCPLAKEILDT